MKNLNKYEIGKIYAAEDGSFQVTYKVIRDGIPVPASMWGTKPELLLKAVGEKIAYKEGQYAKLVEEQV